jgi:hypothetical protein
MVGLAFLCGRDGWDVSGIYRRDFAGLERADDAVDLELAVDVGILLLDVGGFVDGGCHMSAFGQLIFWLLDGEIITEYTGQST